MGKLRLVREFPVREILATRKKTTKVFGLWGRGWKRLELTSKLSVRQRRNYPHIE